MTSATNHNPEESHRRDAPRRNALQHGLRAMTLGSVPTGASYVGKLLSAFRLQLEAVVREAKGSISFIDAAAINTATKWERHGLLATRWLKVHFAEMTLDQKLMFSRDIAKAAENRDKAIAALKLQQEPASIVATLRALHSEPRVTDIAEDGEVNHGN